MAIFVQPSRSNFRNIFFTPFEWILWISVFATCVGIFITSAVAETVSANFSEHYSPEVHAERNSYLWIVAAVCQRSKKFSAQRRVQPRNTEELLFITGFSLTPSLPCVRIPFITGFILALIIYTAYAAEITSVLAITTVPIRSFQDLVDHKYSFYAHEKSTSVQAFVQVRIDILH